MHTRFKGTIAANHLRWAVPLWALVGTAGLLACGGSEGDEEEEGSHSNPTPRVTPQSPATTTTTAPASPPPTPVETARPPAPQPTGTDSSALGGVDAPPQFIDLAIQIQQEQSIRSRGLELSVCDQGLVVLLETEVVDGLLQGTAVATSLGILTLVRNNELGIQLNVAFGASTRTGRTPFEGRFTISTGSSGAPTRLLAALNPGLTLPNEIVDGVVTNLLDASGLCADILAEL